MDNGTARFEKGLTDSSVTAADLASDIAFYVSGTTDGNNNAVFVGNVVMSGGLDVKVNYFLMTQSLLNFQSRNRFTN